jgi:V/A-type H+-transporting ATPase subunit I
LTKIEAELTALSSLKNQLEAEKNSNISDIEFETARAGMELISDESQADFAVSWISGYVPVTDVGSLKRAASENGWALCAIDPAEDDAGVPTKLKNNSVVSTIYPMFRFLDMTPGYRETDVSSWFLVFLALFFGMIFGDASYGAVMVLISFALIAKTAKKGVPLAVKFLLIMSLTTFAWGTLTGTWFGIDIAQLPPLLQNLSLPLIANSSSDPGWLASYLAGNFWIRSGLVTAEAAIKNQASESVVNLQLFCFTIALVHLGLARIRRMIACIKSPRALAQLGRLGMLLGMYFVVLSMIVYKKGFGGVESWQVILLGISFVLYFVFENYKDSIVKSLIASGKDMIGILMNIPGSFSDIMSYIRLWAMGVAGASISNTVNTFAIPMMESFVLVAFGILLFSFGHVFNMVLNAMSVLVHGVRLNTLEFTSHMELEWSGFEYKPFAKRQ